MVYHDYGIGQIMEIEEKLIHGKQVHEKESILSEAVPGTCLNKSMRDALRGALVGLLPFGPGALATSHLARLDN